MSEKIITHATLTAETIKHPGHALHAFAEPSLFFNSLGWFQWKKKNKLTKEEIDLYKKTYEDVYNG